MRSLGPSMTFDAIAHDLKTPLAAALGHARMIAAENLSPAGRRRLAVIETQIQRMSTLIDSYLLGGAVRSDIAVGHAGDVVLQVTREIEPLLQRAGVVLGLVVDHDVPPCRCAPEALHRVLVNVLRNAIDASVSGGSIDCRVGAGAANEVFIEIRDNGSGIPPVVLERLFQRGCTTKSAQGGHGLGLAISRELLQHEGGNIRINSRPGEGTRVLITLKAAGVAA